MKSIAVGEVEVMALTDVEGSFFESRQVFPGVHQEQWEPYLKRHPWTFAAPHTLRGRVSSYLLRTRGLTLLVDTGVGPGAIGRRGRLPADLAPHGVRNEDVDTVFLTHPHGDHLGWGVRPDGEPVFSEASYVTQRAEWEVSARAVASLDDSASWISWTAKSPSRRSSRRSLRPATRRGTRACSSPRAGSRR